MVLLFTIFHQKYDRQTPGFGRGFGYGWGHDTNPREGLVMVGVIIQTPVFGFGHGWGHNTNSIFLREMKGGIKKWHHENSMTQTHHE